MDKKQAYLDALNSGRRRRPTTSIDDLNRTLADLESRISGRSLDSDASDIAPITAAPAKLAAEIETQRMREESLEAAGSIASELKLLRDDLNDKVAADIEREFAALKTQDAPQSRRADDLSDEVERLAGVVGSLAAGGTDANAIRLQSDMEGIKQTLAELARESTLLSVEKRLEAFAGDESELVKMIQSRMEELSAAIATLPEPSAMHALDDKLKLLASAMDRFAQKQGPLGDGALALIDERLDEISRAIAVSAGAGRGLIVDGKPFDRIEARIGSLAKQIDELIEDRPAGDIGAQIAEMSQRIDEIATRATKPHETIARLAEQMSLIAGKVDAIPSSPDLSDIFRGVESRFSAFSQTLDERSATSSAKSEQLFAELDQRLMVLTERLEAVQAGQSRDALMTAMDERFALFTDSFESRLEGISQRLETTTATLASIDPDLVRSLESQVRNLSDAIQAPTRVPAELEDVAPRLERLEQIIADNHAAVLDAARSAAEDAVRALGDAPGRDNDVVQGLADDLRALEALARRSDERNTKTFEAIHDTLLKIVERLGAMDDDGEDDREPARVGIASTPALHADVEDMSIDAPVPADARAPQPSSIEVKEAAAADTQPRSMIARVLNRKRKQKDEPQALAAASSNPIDIDAPIDPAILNQPIEPGLGSPDLNAIMRRVRDERSTQQKDGTPDVDAAKSDFIAAARRAAQAAAAEAETLKSGKSADGMQRFSLSKLLKSKNRAVTMGIVAVTLALAGLQIGKSLTAADDEVAAIAKPAAAGDARAEVAALIQADMTPSVEPAVISDLTAMAKSSPSPRDIAPAAPARIAALPALADPSAADAALQTASIPASQPVAEAAAPIELEADTPSVTAVPMEAGNTVLRAAAEAGDPKAFFEIGNRYAEGRRVERDLKTAALWYESAADEGLAPAQYRLANMLEKGDGVEQDFPRAIALYTQAADKGHASAMHNLAVLYAMGAEGRADNTAAARYFIKAADLGIRDSQFNLGILTARGVGLPQDLTESYKWFAIVAATGDEDAAAKRDEVAKLLTADDLAKAQKKVELWAAKPLNAAINTVAVPDAWTEDMEPTAGIDIDAAIKQVQALLNAKGYDAGQPDGVIGWKTTSAVTAFQKDNQMEPTGQINEPLVRALLALT